AVEIQGRTQQRQTGHGFQPILRAMRQVAVRKRNNNKVSLGVRVHKRKLLHHVSHRYGLSQERLALLTVGVRTGNSSIPQTGEMPSPFLRPSLTTKREEQRQQANGLFHFATPRAQGTDHGIARSKFYAERASAPSIISTVFWMP